MTDTDAAPPSLGPQNGAEELPPFTVRIVAQFIRDLSFENPRAPDSLRGGVQPQIDLGVEMSARGRPDGLFEVDLKLTSRADRDDGPVFQIELLYGGLFQIGPVPDDAIEKVLLIECPRFLFPYARRIISDLTAEGGFPPFMLDPIDFAQVYEARKAQEQASSGGYGSSNLVV